MCGHGHRPTVRVDQLELGQPGPEPVAQRRGAVGRLSLSVARSDRGQQPWAAVWERTRVVSLLIADPLQQPVADRDRRLAVSLVVDEPQHRRAIGKHHDRVSRQLQRVVRAKAGLDQHDHRRDRRLVPEPRKGLIGFELAHHRLVDEPRHRFALGGQLAGVVAGVALQPRPAVTVDILEHDVDPAQQPAPGVGRQRQLRDVIQEIHQHSPREVFRARQLDPR